ncbi:hypothetical protein PVAP13_7KG325150, partial [Panicum virgatum]
MAGGWRRKKTTWRGIVPAHVLLESVGGCDVSRTNITHSYCFAYMITLFSSHPNELFWKLFYKHPYRIKGTHAYINFTCSWKTLKLHRDPITLCQATTRDALLERSWCPSKTPAVQ